MNLRSPIEIIEGKVIEYSPETGDVLIRANYSDWPIFEKRRYGSKCLVQLIDNRKLSDKQRRVCYKLLNVIAEWQGESLERTKAEMKQSFLRAEFPESWVSDFSLSNAPMSLACAFQRYLVRFILDWEVPLRFSLLGFVDDENDYLYSCVARKKCCICGRKSDLHHVDRVGVGRDRESIIHEGMAVLPLCREHHMECHMIGQRTFNDKYHIEGGVVLDTSLCKIYGLKTLAS